MNVLIHMWCCVDGVHVLVCNSKIVQKFHQDFYHYNAIIIYNIWIYMYKWYYWLCHKTQVKEINISNIFCAAFIINISLFSGQTIRKVVKKTSWACNPLKKAINEWHWWTAHVFCFSNETNCDFSSVCYFISFLFHSQFKNNLLFDSSQYCGQFICNNTGCHVTEHNSSDFYWCEQAFLQLGCIFNSRPCWLTFSSTEDCLSGLWA